MNAQVQPETRLGGVLPAAARLAWAAAFALAVGLWFIGSFELAGRPLPSCADAACDPFALSAEDLEIMEGLGLPVDMMSTFWPLTNMGFAIVFFVIALVIFWRAPDVWMGLVVSFTLVFLGAVFFTESDDALWRARPELRWLLAVVYGLGYSALMFFFFYFPDGKFVPRAKRWRAAAIPLILLIAPFTVNAARGEPLAAGLFVGSVAAGIAAQIHRYRRLSKRLQRQQTKWVLFGLMSAFLVMLIWLFTGANLPPGQPRPERIYFLLFSRALIVILIPLLPLSIAFSILRYRLFDIDVIINRALVYGALTALIAGLYVLLVGSAGVVLQKNSDLAALLLTAVLAAAAFRPARSFIQRGVDRMVEVQQPRLSPVSPVKTDGAALPRLSGYWLQVAWAGWIVLAIAAFGVLIASIPGYAAKFGGQLDHVIGGELPPGAHFFAAASGAASLAAALLSIGLATLLFRRRFTEPVAVLLSFFLLAYGVAMAGPLEVAGAYWLGSAETAQALQGVLLATPMIALLALFPNGRFTPPWTRWIVLLSAPGSLGLLLMAPFDAEGINQNPALFTVTAVLFIALSLSGVYAQIIRYRKVSTPAERRQTRWAVFGFALWIAYIILSLTPYFYLTGLPPDASTPWWGPASELTWWLSVSIIPVCLTVAITRGQLWDIDLVINRTLVYGALTAAVTALYVFIVGGLGLLLQSSSNLLLPLLATGLAAALFQPLRQRLQGIVNRLMYGERDDPAALLARLGEHLQQTGSPQAALMGIVEAVAQALKLPYAAIELGERSEMAASYGLRVDEAQPFPLIHQGERVGQMLVSPRAPGESLTAKDRRLLETIARQAGAVAYAARLTADLRRSRQRLVIAREEERRRIRRDLHDGLGPLLASQGLKMAAASRLIEENPAEARRFLDELAAQNEAAVGEIRRLVYNLRPPALDDLGLVGAIRDYAMGLQVGADSPDIDVQAPAAGLPSLPAAVEAAAYRIAAEALTNVTRHAQARNCTVAFRLASVGRGKTLHLEITDDGVGLSPESKAGVGLISMRERAEEIGGSLRIESAPGRGCRVLVALPLETEDGS